ncbi:MAG: type II toxin-antitoxin system VapC family toxin [Vicinamibacterales bacterium]|nr:type II toxin-antitoxin system VapC family toxin [Vicinamibacterales bacterium]
MMTLADTSVWIDHFRRRSPQLTALLERDEVLCHPFIVGELACGSLKTRPLTLRLLQTLPTVPMAAHEEVLVLVERHRLMGTGIGWLDAHLLGSTLLAGTKLWTRDEPLARAAATLGVMADPRNV